MKKCVSSTYCCTTNRIILVELVDNHSKGLLKGCTEFTFCFLLLKVITESFSAYHSFTSFGDQPNFQDRYKFPDKACTYKIASGGWALYSEPDFKGKVMYQWSSKSPVKKLVSHNPVTIKTQSPGDLFTKTHISCGY